MEGPLELVEEDLQFMIDDKSFIAHHNNRTNILFCQEDVWGGRKLPGKRYAQYQLS